MSKNYYCFKQILFYLFLIAYVFLLARILLFKQVSLSELFHADIMISRAFSLTPFKTISEYFSNFNFNIWIALMNVVGNIVLFIPLGLYLQILKIDKNILHSISLVGVISLCVEVTQYILGIGRADIDDIILNISGGLLGIFIYRILYLLFKDENKTKTAVTLLFCIACACFGASILIFDNLLGYKIKIL